MESELDLSTDIINKLRIIKRNNRVAQTIYQIFIDWTDLPGLKYNEIMPGKTKDMVTFIPTSAEGDPNRKNKRSEIKIGRLVKHIIDAIGISYTDTEIEDFVNKWKSVDDKREARFELVSGEEIKYWYDEGNYERGLGSLNKSCMRFKNCNKYLELFVINPDKIKLLIYLDANDQLLGRALIWSLDESPCKTKLFMDRIYVVEDYITNKFIDWSEKNNCFRKQLNTFQKKCSTRFSYQSKSINGIIAVTLLNTDVKYLPYSDTLKYFNKKDGFLCNIGFKDSILLESIDGMFDICPSCGGTAEVDCVFCNKGEQCDFCHGEFKVPCDECSDWKKW